MGAHAFTQDRPVGRQLRWPLDTGADSHATWTEATGTQPTAREQACSHLLLEHGKPRDGVVPRHLVTARRKDLRQLRHAGDRAVQMDGAHRRWFFRHDRIVREPSQNRLAAQDCWAFVQISPRTAIQRDTIRYAAACP